MEEGLLACGAVSITLLSDADEPVLEPAPGETPLWTSIRVQALFDLQTDLVALKRVLAAQNVPSESLSLEFLPPADWQAAQRAYAVNRLFAQRLWVLPTEADPQALWRQQHGETSIPPTAQLRLDPGLAFGTGGHPTTAMCLEWLAEHIQAGQRVLDFGCGSGILGIAAALLGAEVVAVDYDQQACVATRNNAAYNGVARRKLEVVSLEDWERRDKHKVFDVIVANILAGPLRALAANFEQLAKTGGSIVLSGILEEQAAQVEAAYPATIFAPVQVEAGWACLHGVTHEL